jgi:hypothetical protein
MPRKNHSIFVALLIAASCLGACNKPLTIQSEFPSPVMEPYDLAVGVSFPEILANYVEVEESPAISEWEIVLGNTNMRLFDSLFNGMFRHTVIYEQRSDTAADTTQPAVFDIRKLDTTGLDAVIEPILEDLQVSLPTQSGTELYGVWLKYNLKIYRPDGELITSWPVTGFGQVGKNSFTAAGPVRAAAIMAMRDAATNIILNFESQPEIQALLLNKTSISSAIAEDSDAR